MSLPDKSLLLMSLASLCRAGFFTSGWELQRIGTKAGDRSTQVGPAEPCAFSSDEVQR